MRSPVGASRSDASRRIDAAIEVEIALTDTKPQQNTPTAAYGPVGVLLSKSLQLSSDVHLAMQSRGFRGEVYLLDDFQAHAIDWFWLAGFAALALAMLWWQL